MIDPLKPSTKPSQGPMLNLAAVWVFFSGWCVLGGYALSLIHALQPSGIAILLVAGLASSCGLWFRAQGGTLRTGRIRWRRYLKPFPLLYVACVALALTGGLLHSPSNYDALCYRVPRMLHWLSAGQCHWIGSFDTRRDFSSHGFEWLMMPWFGTFGTFRFTFLINVISYLLMPGLVFSVFSSLGVRRSVAATWMWILPCGSCFVMEAGSIGNDFIATIYVLAAMVFALKARESGQIHLVWLALVSTGLMTCAKASNLPLLLPVGICLGAMYFRRPELLLRSAGAAVAGILVSYAPLAVMNIQHTGDWTGSPGNASKLHDPLAGLCGNTLLIATGSLTPSVFPVASSWNKWIGPRLEQARLAGMLSGFSHLNLDVAEIAAEERSGLGLGVTAAMVLGVLGALRTFARRRLPILGTLVALGFWAALLAFMLKLGNIGAARLLACYYPGLIVLPLLLFSQQRVIRARWWRVATWLLLAPIVVALIFTPSRPLLRIDRLIEVCGLTGTQGRLYARTRDTYEVYANRPDANQAVRALLPAGARMIGFAGTGDESEYSFWLPRGTRSVRDFTPRPDRRLPDPTGLDAIVTSDWGCNDRFNMTPEQLSTSLGWHIIGTTRVKNYASGPGATWSVIVPIKTIAPD